MDRKTYIAVLVAGLALLLALPVVEANGTACDYEGCTWLATGTVTKIEGSKVFLLGKDNVVYTIDRSQANVIYDGCESLKVGLVVRVYGTVTGANQIRASQMRVCPPGSVAPSGEGAGPTEEIRIIVEPETAPTAPAPTATQPPAAVTQPANWSARGLVTSVDYTGRKVMVNTPSGQFTINVGGAALSNGSRAIPLASLSQGDAVRITGRLCGLNEVDAVEFRVVRTRTDAEGALPQKPVSLVGTIQQIDYPSFTFTMTTDSTPVVVLVDQSTYVQQHGKRTAFMELRPGMRVRMSGSGNLGTGFAAREIQIIGVSPQ